MQENNILFPLTIIFKRHFVPKKSLCHKGEASAYGGPWSSTHATKANMQIDKTQLNKEHLQFDNTYTMCKCAANRQTDRYHIFRKIKKHCKTEKDTG